MRNIELELIQKYFEITFSGLTVGGVPVPHLVEQFGTPLYVYDVEIMRQQWRRLRKTLPSTWHIHYSVKANPNPSIIKVFVGLACGLEVASGGELFIALESGCPPQNILFAGPGKTVEELEYALKEQIGEIHIESAYELDRVISLARRMGCHPAVAVRVNAAKEIQGGAMRMGGKPTQFGIDEDQLAPVLDTMIASPYVRFQGVHLFTGTQILDHSVLAAQYQKGIDLAKWIAQNWGVAIATVDFGGGFGIPYFQHEKELDLDQFSQSLIPLMESVCKNEAFSTARFIVEPGRFLVGPSGLYLTRVIDIKISKGKKFLIVDGGMNHHLAASGNLGQVIRRNFPITIVHPFREETREVVDIVGPLCTPLDTLARDICVPKPHIGDIIGIFQSGAYARSASPLGFLSHPTPPEVMIDKKQVSLIRKRGSYSDLFYDLI